jgi:hypothetical protein
LTTPDRHEVQVATSTLRAEAQVWDHESRQLAATAARAEALDLNRVEAGIFQLLVSAHNSVVTQVASRCREGRQQTAQIAATLRQVATTYDTEDAKNAHRIRGLY